MDPGDVSLLVYNFKDKYYFDKFLSMGLRSAAYICQKVTNAVRFMCTLLSIAVVNYLDDFAGADKPELVFIGVYFYTEDFTLSVTPERVRETLDLIDL